MIILFVVLGILWIVAFGLMLRKFIVGKARRKSDEWSRTQLMWQSLYHTRRQQMMAYWTLSIGVFTVFAVGLNRPDFTDAEMFGKATGGYDLYVDVRVPIQYDLNTSEVRAKLSLTDLPDSTRFLSFMRHTEDEASCLNLNKVATPTVLGIDLQKMLPFGLEPFKPFDIPAVYIDEEALIWSMMKPVGDTILYTNHRGESVPVIIAGTYPTGIFHGNAIMSKEDFRSLWQEESGVEVLLVKTDNPEEASELLARALSEYGLSIQTTSDRIKMFFEVTDTYLIIFLTLGAIGMLLGIFSLVIIVRKNLTANASTIRQFEALGFGRRTIGDMLVRENVLVPMVSVLVGAFGSVVSILANATGAGLHAILMALAWLALLLAAVYCGIKAMVRNELKTNNTKLIMKKLSMLLLAGAMASCTMTAQVPPQVTPFGWRGPAHNGNYPDTGLLAEWPAEGPELVFETSDAGKGYSSPLVVGDRVYLTGMNEDENKEVLNCYNLKGEKQYTVEYGNPWKQSFPETRTTPAIVDGKAYVISGMGEIVCINIADGSIVWSVDGGTKYGRKTGMWGTSECPLVYNDKVIYTPCGDQTTMVALNKETGEEIWKTRALGDMSGYVSPIMIEYKGKYQIVGSTAFNAIGVNPDNGDIEWTFDDWGPKHTGKKSNLQNIAPNSALYKDGKIFFCHGYDLNGFQLQLADDLKSVTCTWRTETLDTHHGGYVLVNGKIFGSNWINNNDGNWCCLDWETGNTDYEEKWSGGAGKGSIISADGKLYVYDERRGFVGLVNPTPEKFDVVSKFRVAKGSGPYWAHMHINDGILYLRHGEYFAAYKIK